MDPTWSKVIIVQPTDKTVTGQACGITIIFSRGLIKLKFILKNVQGNLMKLRLEVNLNLMSASEN